MRARMPEPDPDGTPRPAIDRIPRLGPNSARLALLGAAATVAVVLFATFARQQGVAKANTIWAEDGRDFVECPYLSRAPLSCLVRPYAGYLHTVPRIGGLIASELPPTQLPLVLTTLAALVAAAAGLAIFLAVRGASGSIGAGIVAGTAIALTDQAGREVSGNLTNLHWILLVAAAVVIVSTWLGHRPSWLEITIVGACALSSAFAPLLPVLAGVAAALGAARSRLLLAVSLVGAGLQVLVTLAQPRHPVTGPIPGLGAILGHWWTDVIVHGNFGTYLEPPGWTVAAGLLTTLAVLVAVRLTTSRRPSDATAQPRLAGPLAFVIVAVALVAVGAAVFLASIVLNRQILPRYGYVPAVMIVEALALAVGGAGLLAPPAADRVTSGLRVLCRLALPAAALLLVIGFGRSFSLVARASNGPAFASELARGRAACADGGVDVEVPISPSTRPPIWFVAIPCARLGP